MVCLMKTAVAWFRMSDAVLTAVAVARELRTGFGIGHPRKLTGNARAAFAARFVTVSFIVGLIVLVPTVNLNGIFEVDGAENAADETEAEEATRKVQCACAVLETLPVDFK